MQILNNIIGRSTGYITRYFGWRNWSVLHYNSVAENIFLLFYIALRDQLYSYEYIIDLFIFIAFSMFSTTYGYLINDFADKELDALHGKDNTFKSDSVWKAGVVVVVFMTLSIVAGMKFVGNPLFLPLWLCWIIIATFYSLKPIRLKERGWVGLLFVVIAQRVLPTMLIFAAFNHLEPTDVGIFTAYIFFRGLSSDLNHQLEDYQKDITTGTETYAIQAGASRAKKAFRYALEMEKLLLLLCIVVACWKLRHLQLWGIPLMTPMLIAYAVLYGLSVIHLSRSKMTLNINPFVTGRKDIFQFIHHAFPSVILPLYILLTLVLETRLLEFVCLTLLFVLYRKLYSIRAITNSYPIQFLKNMVQRI